MPTKWLRTVGLLALCGLASPAWAMGPHSTLGDYFTGKKPPLRRDFEAKHWMSEAEIQAGWPKLLDAVDTDPDLNRCLGTDVCKSEVRHWVGWDYWIRLNLEAASLWHRMTECQGGNVEKTRQAYYEARNFCPGSPPDDAAIRDALLGFHGRIRDFMDTTSIQWIDGIEDWERIVRLGKLLPLHPLFAQVVEEYASTVVRYHELFGWTEDRPYSSEFSYQINVELGAYEKVPSHPSYRRARAYINSIFLMRLFPLDAEASLPQWGLWQEASLRLVYLTSYQTLFSHEAFVGSSFLHLKKVPRARDFRTAEWLPIALRGDSSGDFRLKRWAEHLPAFWHESKSSVVFEFRGIAERYGLPTDARYSCDHPTIEGKLCLSLDPVNEGTAP